jgi:imidazoleglycerol phosphate synthase glutamine amidotransferase subunit HisH
MRWLTENNDDAIHEAVKRGALLLGICRASASLHARKMGTTPGLGLVRGEVRQYDGILPVPQIG